MNSVANFISSTSLINSRYSQVGVRTSVAAKPVFSKNFTSLVATTALFIGIVGQDVADVASLTKLPFEKIKNTSIAKADTWISMEVLNWLGAHSKNASNDMYALKEIITEVFGSAYVTTEMYVDPDESWSKVLVKIDSNLGDDFDKQIHLEDQLFSAIWKSTSLKALSQSLIITQS
jgi:hypothetical protein